MLKKGYLEFNQSVRIIIHVLSLSTAQIQERSKKKPACQFSIAKMPLTSLKIATTCITTVADFHLPDMNV